MLGDIKQIITWAFEETKMNITWALKASIRLSYGRLKILREYYMGLEYIKHIITCTLGLEYTKQIITEDTKQIITWSLEDTKQIIT